MNKRTVMMVALLSFTGEEGFQRRGARFLASRSRAKTLSEPIKGKRQALAQILYETQVSVEPVEEIKETKSKKKTITEVPKKKKRTRKKKDK